LHLAGWVPGKLISASQRCPMKKELFICDSCGARTRLNNAQRHWCGVCTQGTPVEMRYVRDKKPLILDSVVDDTMQKGAAVRSLQSAYRERDFVLRATASSYDGVHKSVNVCS
jgi:hypothetical protein